MKSQSRSILGSGVGVGEKLNKEQLGHFEKKKVKVGEPALPDTNI